jgi:hypothetical protein
LATKTFVLESIGNVTVIKRKGNRHLKLTISPDGKVRVSIPPWAPYRAGLDFVISKQPWINTQLFGPTILNEGDPIGRAHHLHFEVNVDLDRPKGRINKNLVLITYPPNLPPTSFEVQKIASQTAIRALRKQAESLLPQRLKLLSTKHNLPVSEVKVKQLSRRWGSCDQKKLVVLNLFLVQMPWELIDYVILHELTHTKHLNHGPEFWGELELLLPNARQLKKQLNEHHPGIITSAVQ